jgi:hypothetical protein
MSLAAKCLMMRIKIILLPVACESLHSSVALPILDQRQLAFSEPPLFPTSVSHHISCLHKEFHFGIDDLFMVWYLCRKFYSMLDLMTGSKRTILYSVLYNMNVKVHPDPVA